MPQYEYEKLDDPCEICPGRFAVIQGINEDPITHCPTCGLRVKKVISKASIKIHTSTNADKAAKHGLTTYKRAQEGTWEKVGGDGVDFIQGTPEDIQSVKAEKKKPKKINLD
jgi:putative FmdB family regulatory protein